MAEQEGRTTNALVSMFHDEILDYRGEVPNVASVLRVTCMRYLQRRLMAAERTTHAAAPPLAAVRPLAPPQAQHHA